MNDAVYDLKQIAAQLRNLRQSLDFESRLNRDAVAGDLVLKAVGLGAFNGPRYVALKNRILRQQVHPSPDSLRQIFLETFCFVHPEGCVDYDLSYGLVGDAIEAEAAKIEAATKPAAGEDQGGGSRLEWSKPVSYKDLRTALTICQNTLKGLLVKGEAPVTGKIMYKAPTKTARKIQVVVFDLPADLQTRYRRSGK